LQQLLLAATAETLSAAVGLCLITVICLQQAEQR